MNKNQERGYFDYVPYFLWGKNGEFIPLYTISDAVMECAKVGVKAWNFLLEDVEITEESLRKSGLIEILRQLYKN